MKKTILAAVLMAAMCAVAAGVKVGTVNMVDLVRLHPNHESNRALVRSTDKDYKAKLDRQQEGAKAIADEGKKAQADLMNPMLSPSAKLAAQQELRSAAQHFQNELTDLETRLLKLETEDIRAKINAFAKANGYDIIADSTMLAFSKETLDVTDEILKALKVDPAKRREKKAEASSAK